MGGVMVSLAGTLRFLMGSLSKPGYTEKLLAYTIFFLGAATPRWGLAPPPMSLCPFRNGTIPV